MIWLKVIGLWLVLDGIISIGVYPKQSWWREHSVRVVRILTGIALIIWGRRVYNSIKEGKMYEQTTGGWTCPYCGTAIPYEQAHICPILQTANGSLKCGERIEARIICHINFPEMAEV